MLVYPELASGALAQYPMARRRRSRTVVNGVGDGSSIRYADVGGGAVSWTLDYAGLVDAEAEALEGFFRATEGRLKSFVFPDPMGNLLAWSEEFAEAAWAADPQIVLTGGQGDPFGTQRAFRVANGSGGAQGLRQTVELPAGRTYCFSVYARSTAPAALELSRGAERRTRAVGVEWARLDMGGESAAAGDSVTFGIELASGSEVTIFGAQVEGQMGASGYKRTGGRGGVYGNARFVEDVLRITTEGVNRHSCRVQITHAEHI